MESGEVRERYLTGKNISMDFPMINGSFTGLKNRFGYAQVVDSVASSSSGTVSKIIWIYSLICSHHITS